MLDEWDCHANRGVPQNLYPAKRFRCKIQAAAEAQISALSNACKNLTSDRGMKTMNNRLLQSHKIGSITLVFCLICLVGLLSGTAGAAAKRTYFTGTETVGGITDPGEWITDGSKIYIANLTQSTAESASDPRISGEGTITANAVWDAVTLTGPIWGTIRIENNYGSWNGYWQGTRSSESAGVKTSIVATAEGSGAYEGLVARWNYTGVNVDQTGQLSSSGFIVEAKGGPGDLPLQVSATRTERFTYHPGVVITPPAQPPYNTGMTATWEILEEVDQATHFGRSEDTGMGLIDPTTGMVSGSGCVKTASGDLVFWVLVGQVLEPGHVTVTIHFAGGTGRFDAVVGEATSTISMQMEPTADPLVFLSHYSYGGTGAIRY